MRMLGRAAVAAALTAAVAAPASGQFWRGDFGINGGYAWYTDLLDNANGLVIDDPLVDRSRDAKFDDNWLVGSQLGYWFTRNFGIRANGRYTQTDLDQGLSLPLFSEDLGDFIGNLNRSVNDINLWTLTGDLMFRFKKPNDDWSGTEFLPYIAGGLGAKWINLDTSFSCVEFDQVDLTLQLDSFDCAPFGVIFDPNNVLDVFDVFALRDAAVFAGLVGLGADVRFAPNWAVRLEVNDVIYKPKVYVATFDGTNEFILPFGRDNVAETVNEISGVVGIHYLFGLQRPEVVAVVPQPAPPPPPPPPPPPREEDVTICIVETTGPGMAHIRVINAKFLVASGDTVVDMAGRRVLLRESIGTIAVASDQDWYVRGTPFVLTGGPYRAEFVTYGQPTMRSPESLTFLGTVNGVAVFADRDEVEDIRPRLEVMTTRDLTVIVRENPDLRDEIDDIKTLYIPHRAIGCTFQPVLRQEPVRKGGKDGI